MQPQSALAITRHDYQAMPQGPPYFQVIEGDLVMSPSPTGSHQRVALRIARIIDQFLEKRSLGQVFIAPFDVFLTETNVYQPDVLFVSARRKSIINEHGIEGAPDLVVEVLSPSSAGYDKGSKRKIYSKTGVREYWLVDPETKSVQIFDLPNSSEIPELTHGSKAKFSSRLLPGLIFNAASIFRV